MRQITRDLRQLPQACDEYEKGRTACREGVSFTDLPISAASLVRSGWLDELADTVYLLAQQGAPADPQYTNNVLLFINRSSPTAAPAAPGPAKPMSSYKPLEHHKAAAAAPQAQGADLDALVCTCLANGTNGLHELHCPAYRLVPR